MIARRASALPWAFALAAACAGAPGARRAPSSKVHPAVERIEASPDLDGALVGPPAAGQRATLVIVFASWCGACRHELALIEDLNRREPRLRVVGVNAYESWSDLSDETRLREFLRDAPWLRVVHGDRTLLRELGGVPKIPSLFLFARDGRLVTAWRRQERLPPEPAELERAIALAVR